METKRISKGQILIPLSMRRRLGIKEGTRIQIELNEDAQEITLKPFTPAQAHSLLGKFKGKGLMKILMADKKKEREL